MKSLLQKATEAEKVLGPNYAVLVRSHKNPGEHFAHDVVDVSYFGVFTQKNLTALELRFFVEGVQQGRRELAEDHTRGFTKDERLNNIRDEMLAPKVS